MGKEPRKPTESSDTAFRDSKAAFFSAPRIVSFKSRSFASFIANFSRVIIFVNGTGPVLTSSSTASQVLYTLTFKGLL